MNYREEQSSGNLRLNRFFPLQHFVVHRHDRNKLCSCAAT